MRNVPILLSLALLAACSSAPPPAEPAPDAPQTAADEERDAGAAHTRGEQLAAFALSLRGARYRYGGAAPDGFDCSGLVFYAHRELDLTVPRTARDQAEAAERVKPRKLEPGDLVFFKIGSSHVNHVGIYIGKHQFVHAPGAGKVVTVNSLDDEFYAETFSSAGRLWSHSPN
jgi:cell wall-associated NlpC family hydrolase